jgi:hypothetical protein
MPVYLLEWIAGFSNDTHQDEMFLKTHQDFNTSCGRRDCVHWKTPVRRLSYGGRAWDRRWPLSGIRYWWLTPSGTAKLGELKWFEIGKTNSVGNYRHFDYSSEFSQRFECLPCH